MLMFLMAIGISFVFTRAAYAQAATEQTQEKAADGWQSGQDGAKYYYQGGAALTGLQTINGSVYYFGSDGKMQTGLVRLGKDTYYFAKNGKGIAGGWVKCDDGKKRYGRGGGRIAVGACKIKKTWYGFNADGTRHMKKGVYKVNGKRYYCKGKGKLKTGWLAIKNYAYYFSKKDAARVYNAKVGSLKIGKKGRLGKAYAMAIRILNKRGWSLKKAYRYSTSLSYAYKGMRRSSPEKYAIYGYKHHKGNCFVMASTFYIMAKLLGYNVRQVHGKVLHSTHSWVELKKKNGKVRVYDPEFEVQTGRNGWNIYYGKHGTWRYTIYNYMK